MIYDDTYISKNETTMISFNYLVKGNTQNFYTAIDLYLYSKTKYMVEYDWYQVIFLIHKDSRIYRNQSRTYVMNRDEGVNYLSHIYDLLLTSRDSVQTRGQMKKINHSEEVHCPWRTKRSLLKNNFGFV